MQLISNTAPTGGDGDGGVGWRGECLGRWRLIHISHIGRKSGEYRHLSADGFGVGFCRLHGARVCRAPIRRLAAPDAAGEPYCAALADCRAVEMVAGDEDLVYEQRA
jgi:hypothetical protein